MFHFMALLPSSMLDPGGRWYLMGLSGQWYLLDLSAKVVNTVSVLVGMYTSIEISTFHTSLNTGRTDHILAIPANFGQYRPVQKNVYIYIYIYIFKFFNFLIFVRAKW